MASCKQFCPLSRSVRSDGAPSPGGPAAASERAALWGHPQLARRAYGLRIAAVVVVLDFQFCVFLQGALKEKRFQSAHVQTDLM